ncbi:MAG: EAL domain-containing protein [Gammaproteobacteria bacterium]|nr:EAL domain-containing protein [Gammaproteobacteria bacterium]
MTLFKQIALLVSLTFILLASIILITDFSRAGQFIQGQLQTTAQDMSTTLGVAISSLPDGSDPASIEVLFNSVFDSGYYTKIELIGVDGSVIHQKSQEISLEAVPAWFINLVSLSPAQGSAPVMKGWTQLGELHLVLHPGFAYSGLFDTLKSTLIWFALLLAVAIIVLWIVLHYLLIPLQKVREQAEAIHRNQFVQQTKLPTTTELKLVVEAMNGMVAKVQGVFNDQEQTLSHYQHQLYHDKLTGLGNRRYMIDHLQQSISEESSFHGCLGIIKLVNFDQLRERLGYEQSDRFVRAVAELVVARQLGFEAEKVARLGDDEFAFLIATDEASARVFIKSVFSLFKSNSILSNMEANLHLVAGLTTLDTSSSVGELLSDIDYSLTQAVNAGPYSIECNVSVNNNLPQGKMQWRKWLNSVIRTERLFLVGQVVLKAGNKAVQKELFIRAYGANNQVIPASTFMPMASSLGMALEIDKAVFRLVRGKLDDNQDMPLALNLSVAFFEKAGAQEEFKLLLDYCKQKNAQLCFEASHHVLLQHPQMCSQVAERVRRYGHQFGIDNLDLGQSLQLLQSAEFDYVKINATTLKEMSAGEISVGYQALKTITNTLEIQIIAVGVDSQQLFNELQALGIEIMQGNLLNEPQTL